MRILLLAWRYIAFHKVISAILLISVTTALYLPVTVNMLIERLEEHLFARANNTPLIVGARGSRFDLTLNTLYYEARAPHVVSMEDNHEIAASGLVEAIPIHVRFRAKGYPIVGTTIDYLEFRRLSVAEGHSLRMLGDCLVGATAAEELGLKPGDRLLSDPENVFDIGGDYPLNMRVVGILAHSQSPDDNAVIVDIKTAWIIEGIGHGHQDLSRTVDSTLVLQRSDSNVVANAALPLYTEVTPDNIASFHFHADPEHLPLTAIIAVPHDDKSRVLLEGRYDHDGARLQILRPGRVVAEMMAMVLKIKQFFDVGSLAIGAITGLFLAIVILLSSRLRRREMHTMFKLGCSRMTIFWVQFTEVALIIVVSALCAWALMLISLPLATDMVKNLIT